MCSTQPLRCLKALRKRRQPVVAIMQALLFLYATINLHAVTQRFIKLPALLKNHFNGNVLLNPKTFTVVLFTPRVHHSIWHASSDIDANFSRSRLACSNKEYQRKRTHGIYLYLPVNCH